VSLAMLEKEKSKMDKDRIHSFCILQIKATFENIKEEFY
jgi:hypothetical protein